MPQVSFQEIECRSALNRVRAPSMPFLRWSLNPYRGCQHGCAYCYARGSHEFLGFDGGRDFEQRVIVKANLVDVLRRELRRPGWRREEVAIGTACDPYQEAELRYGLTRGALRCFRDHANPCSLTTKSPHIVRDLPILRELAGVAECTVLFSIVTLREEVRRHIEPGTAEPRRRLEAMARVAAAGIRCGVMLAPIIPGLTDDAESMEAVVQAAREHGAEFVFEDVLNLKPAAKAWFLPLLREGYPHLLPQYERLYHGVYAPQRYREDVHTVVREVRERWGLAAGQQRPRQPVGQLELAL